MQAKRGVLTDISINCFLFQVKYSQENHAEQVKSQFYSSYLTNKTLMRTEVCYCHSYTGSVCSHLFTFATNVHLPTLWKPHCSEWDSNQRFWHRLLIRMLTTTVASWPLETRGVMFTCTALTSLLLLHQKSSHLHLVSKQLYIDNRKLK